MEGPDVIGLLVECRNEPGVLYHLTEVIFRADANITYVAGGARREALAEIQLEVSGASDRERLIEDLEAVPGVTAVTVVPTFQIIFGKRVIVIGGGAQVGMVAQGAVSEADRHNIRGERISVDTIPLVGEEQLADAVRAVARLHRARILVLAGALMGGDITNAWGVYNPLNAPPVPSMTNDSAATILADWSRWNLTAFGLNPMLKPAMAMPVVANDQYNATAGVALTVLAPGILGNDKDLNSGGPGIALVARKVGDPAHGTLNLNADGSFGYMPSAGFKGTDTFRYSVFDGRIDSVRPGVVTIRVN